MGGATNGGWVILKAQTQEGMLDPQGPSRMGLPKGSITLVTPRCLLLLFHLFYQEKVARVPTPLLAHFSRHDRL